MNRMEIKKLNKTKENERMRKEDGEREKRIDRSFGLASRAPAPAACKDRHSIYYIHIHI